MPPRLVSITFLLLVFGPPIGQAGWELARGESIQALDVVGSLREDELRVFEDELREASFVHRLVSPYYQWALVALGKGNEKAILGDDDWIYYRDDLNLVTAPGFLEPGSASPVDAVVDLQQRLRQEGVELLFVPVPAKIMVEPGHLSRWTRGLAQVANTDTGAFLRQLEERGVAVVDLAARFEREAGGALYLARDTHWTPSTMALAAAEIARRSREVLDRSGSTLTRSARYESRVRTVESAGDMIGMLRLPAAARPFELMRFDIEEVLDAASGQPLEFTPDAEVLLMGDSFTGVFSDPRFELGEHAGLGEHLARELSVPLDVIMIAGGAARSVRESLARRAQGLAGKKLVIWQISQRELVETDDRWEPVALPLATSDAPGVPGVPGDPGDPGDPGAPSGALVLAEVAETSRVPEGFEYDFCLAIYEYRVIEVRSGSVPAGPLWVAHVAVEDFDPQPGGRYAVGNRQLLHLDDIAAHHDLESTSFIDDTDAGRRIWFATSVEPE